MAGLVSAVEVLAKAGGRSGTVGGDEVVVGAAVLLVVFIGGAAGEEVGAAAAAVPRSQGFGGDGIAAQCMPGDELFVNDSYSVGGISV